MTDLRIHVRLMTERNFGDHGEFVLTSHEVQPDETVEHLVCRLMELGEFQRPYRNPLLPHARIELQYVAGTEPEPTPGQVVASNEPIF